MADPLSISQLIAGIPQVIDYTVKTIRLLRKYRKIDGDFLFSLERAEHLVYCLRSHLIIAQCTELTVELQCHILKALTRAHQYMKKLNTVLDDWKTRLQRYDGQTSVSGEAINSEKLDLLSCETSSMQSSLTTTGGPCGLRLRSTLRPVRLQLNRLRYMVLGTISIQEALHKLETSNKVLAEFLPISQHLTQLMTYDEAITDFTRKAKQRDEPCTRLSISLARVAIEESDDPMFFKVTEEGEYKGCIIERRNVQPLNQQEKAKALIETDRLTRMLREDKQAADGITTTEIGILRCCGYIVPHEDAHDLIFRKPVGHTARTLRNLLCTPASENHYIDDRLDFAIKIVNAVHVFHSIGFVHKGIKPESILVMQPLLRSSESFYSLGIPYLSGFNAIRYDENASGMYSFDKTMNKKLYLHPRQLISNRPQKYLMRDDVYSLGVCLLEIGLWRSVFRWDETKPKGKRYVVAEWAEDLFADPPYNDDDDDDLENEDGEYLADVMRKEKLTHMAKTLLPMKMSSVYSKVVVTCLTFDERHLGVEKKGDYAGSAKFFSDVICELRRAKVV